MGIGASIFLIALGLILALAVDVNLSGIDLQLVGWILAVVGVVGLLITLTALDRRRTTVREEAVLREPPMVRREERVIREDPPPPPTDRPGWLRPIRSSSSWAPSLSRVRMVLAENLFTTSLIERRAPAYLP